MSNTYAPSIDPSGPELEGNPDADSVQSPPLDERALDPMGDRPGGKDGRLTGRRILVAEDNAIIAMDVQMMLEDQGVEIIGPLSTVAEALAAANGDRIDAALLDIDLNGDDSLPVIDALLQKRVPVVLITGHDIAKRLPSDYASLPVVAKPFTEGGVVSALEKALVADKK